LPFDISTAQSLFELEQWSARGLGFDEVVRRLENEGVDPERARWLVRLHRRRHRAESLSRIGYALTIFGAVATIVVFVLALTDSRYAPPWLYVFIPAYLLLFSVLAAWGRMLVDLTVPLDLLPVESVPPLLASVPRNAVDNGRRRRMMFDLCAGLGMLTLAMPLATIYPRVREWAALRARGVESTGTITSKRDVHRGNSRVRLISFRFPADGEIVDTNAAVPRARYDRLREGDSIPVTYLEGNTWANLPEHKRDLTWSFLIPLLLPVLAMVAGMGLVVALFFLAMRRFRARIFAVIRDGRAAIAEIRTVQRGRFTYAFETAEGTREGFHILQKKRLRTPAVAGQKVVILYDAARPQTNLVVAAMDDVVFQ
jgi:hypothetical protein